MRTAADTGVRMLRHVARGFLFGGLVLLTGFSAFAGVPDPSAPAASFSLDDAAAVKWSAALEAVPAMPGTAIIVSNPYGELTVTGGTLVGNTIYDLQPNAVIQLGTVAGSGGAALALHFQGFNIGSGNMLTLRSGAPLQVVVLYNADSSASAIAGVLQAEGGNGALPPYVYFANPNGLDVTPGGSVASMTGLTIDTLGISDLEGQPFINDGVIDGGAYLRLQSARITGSGAFRGNNAHVSTFGNANNPIHGAYYLSNGLQFYPSSGTAMELTLNDYGNAPQFLNLMVNGDASVFMPSDWPPAWSEPPNNLPVPLGGIRPPGVPEPSYGGGSMIVQATGSLTLRSSKSNDFVFPGAIVLKAGGTLNLNGVLVNQGWTAAGKAFQGVFLESPYITSSDTIRVATNNLNWVNFSTFPHAPVRTWQFVPMPDGSLQYVTADDVAPHLNTYSLLIEIAAAGGCWTCVVNYSPVNMY